MKKIYLILFCCFFTGAAFAQGPVLLKDIAPGSDNSNPSYLIASDNYLYYKANDIASNLELVVSDGTTEGTFFFDLLPGTYINTLNGSELPKTSFIRYPVIYKGKPYMNARYYYEPQPVGPALTMDAYYLWDESLGLTDGKPDTVRMFDGLIPYNYGEYGGKLYFSNYTTPKEIYSWDGVNAPEVLPNQIDSIVSSGIFVQLGSKFIILGKTTNAKTGNELMAYSIETGEIEQLGDLTAGSSSSAFTINDFTVLNDKVYFELQNKLWETDGTAAGTKTIITEGSFLNDTNQVYSTANPFAWNGKVYFAGKDLFNGGTTSVYDVQLYAYDPANNTVTQITQIEKDGAPGTYNAHYPKNFCSFNNKLYYVGRDGAGKYRLYETDGVSSSPVSTTITAEGLNPVVLKGKLYFSGAKDDGTTGKEIFVFDPLLSSVSSLEKSKGIELYPNPSNGTLYVKGITDANASYAIYNMSGSIVDSGNIQYNRIDFNLNPGAYVLRINDSESVKNQKFLVK